MADAKKRSLGKEFTKGLVKENPVLRLVLGTCPTLAVTTSVTNAIGMGIAATIVLVCSNIVISALRKLIPDKVRIPAYIVIIDKRIIDAAHRQVRKNQEIHYRRRHHPVQRPFLIQLPKNGRLFFRFSSP